MNYNLSLNSTRPVITVIDLSQFLLLQNTVNALLTPPLRLKIWNKPPFPPPRKTRFSTRYHETYTVLLMNGTFVIVQN